MIPDKLYIIWTTRDREVALNMILMYAINAKINNWWSQVTLIIWGPSAELIVEDKELRLYIKKCLDSDVELKACKACADRYGVSAQLEALGIDVIYMGKPLTALLKENEKILTF